MYKISACCCRILLTSNTVDGIYYFRLVVFFLSFFFCIRLIFALSLLTLLKMNLEREENLFFHILYLSKFYTILGGVVRMRCTVRWFAVRAGMSKLLSLQTTWADFELMYISLGKGGLQDIRAVCLCLRSCVRPCRVQLCVSVPLC